MSNRGWQVYPGGPTTVRGTLRVCAFDGQPHPDPGGARVVHTSEFVAGPSYDGMEDNDIRGFLDGGFQWAFNQMGQAHVRAGRNASRPMHLRYGEPEVFRVLQRWDGIRLPRGTSVLECRLRLHIEFTSQAAQRVVLYAVHKDWDPGQGGVDRNNVSVPNPGELWWNEIGFGEREWALPGASFADDQHPDSDTDSMPLAEALVEPGDGSIEFSSRRLAEYANECLEGETPLLFLVKLSDSSEDTPGSLTAFFSASEGDSLNRERRPSLRLAWRNPDCRVLHEQSVFLEHGRTTVLPALEVPEGTLLCVDFESDPVHELPTVEMRTGPEGASTDWRGVDGLVRSESHRTLLRAVAVRNPVTLGKSLEAWFEDTWVLTAPPEHQDVFWEFLSPSGVQHRQAGDYEGRFRWSVSFRPDEVGRWQCRLVHALAASPYMGPPSPFDVVVEDPEQALDLLRSLIPRIACARQDGNAETLDVMRQRLIHAQRGLMRGQTPERYRSPIGRELREELRKVRSALWGQPVPEQPPFESFRLYTKHEGADLRDPIPYTSHLKRSTSPPSVGFLRRSRRVWGRLRRRTIRAFQLGTKDTGSEDE